MKLGQALWTQALAIAVVSTILALLANGVHPRGLNLTRNYFPPALEHPFQVIGIEDVKEYAQYLSDGPGGFTFLDARKQESYQAEHLPGALLCDHYQQDRFIPGILSRLAEAMIIVIYCTGGNCEDSIFLANDLVYQHGIAPEVLHIFEGGINAWREAGLPLNTGAKP